MEGDDQKLGFGVATSDYDKSERADMEGNIFLYILYTE